MRMFGFTSLPLNVTCDASLNFVNTDVMLVLDITGSMAGTSTAITRHRRQQKITALRDAVMALYDELRADPDPARRERPAAALRHRALFDDGERRRLIRGENPAYLADSVPYQSRVANYNTLITTRTAYSDTRQPPAPPVIQTLRQRRAPSRSAQICRNVGFHRLHAERRPSSGGPAPTPTWTPSLPE